MAICTQSTLLSGSRSAPHARAPATVGVCGTVGATPGTTWSNGACTRRSLHARSPVPRRALAANPNPTDDAISRRRVRHHRARSLPAARAAGGVHPVWARGGHVTGTWPRLYFVKNVLLIGVFTEETFFRGAAEGGKPILQDGFRAKTNLFPTYQDLAGRGQGSNQSSKIRAPRPGGLVRVPKRRQRCAHQRPLSLSPEDHGA